jgi:hypothetical protein
MALNAPNGLKVPNGHTIFRNIHLQGLQTYAKIGIFGLKVYRLATLEKSRRS